MMISLLTLLASNIAAGSEIIINNAEEFVEFSDNVNGGQTYKGTTVFLGADIDLSDVNFSCVGKDDSNYFNGVFDGQGHAISNFNLKTSSKYAGLFGYSGGESPSRTSFSTVPALLRVLPKCNMLLLAESSGIVTRLKVIASS